MLTVLQMKKKSDLCVGDSMRQHLAIVCLTFDSIQKDNLYNNNKSSDCYI